MRAALSLAIASAVLSACGGGNSQTQNQNPVDYSQLKATPQSSEALVLVSDTELDRHLKNGLRLNLKGGAFLESAPPTATTDAGGSKGNFSQTNVHVAGVDEADYAKYDGDHWFIATYPQYAFDVSQPQRPGFQIVATDPAGPDAEIVGSFKFDDEWGDVGSMYLVQDAGATSHVATVRTQWGNVYPYLPGFPIDLMIEPAVSVAALDAAIWPGPRNSKVRVQLVNVTTPSTPAQDWEIQLDGSLIDSRKIGNTLYLITRFDPWITELDFERGDSKVRDANETTLEDVEVADLMPHYTIGAEKKPLSRDCYVQAGIEDHHGFASLVHITAIDLGAQKLLGSTCLNSSVENLSMSEDALYLTGTIYDATANAQATVVHKFALPATGPSYEATGSVTGSLGWASDPTFRMHEHEGQFRIVTSSWTDTGPAHRLTILTQEGDALKALSTLPNASHPAPIGKPGEDIYAVRFNADRAYVVTFRRTDPLYALDLSDAANPVVAGELEIPGFATYIHPVGDNLLFTLGNSADETGVVTGIKADLLDVSGNAPKVINSVPLSSQYGHSEALHNLRALSLLAAGEDQLRIALPLTSYTGDRWNFTGLQLLEINGLGGGEASLQPAGVVVAESPSVSTSLQRTGIDRGILHDNAVFYTHNNAVWAANWDAPDQAKGPIGGEPVICTEELRSSLHITVLADPLLNGTDLCSAEVVATQGDALYRLEHLSTSAAGTCEFYGPGEVGGFFTVSVELDGYLPEHLKEIFVPKDVCHVQTQEFKVLLKPE